MLVVVMLMLVASSLLVFSALGTTRETYRDAVGRFRRSCALYSARGGVFRSVAYLASFRAPHLGVGTFQTWFKDSQTEHRFEDPVTGEDETVPTGWFVAVTPFPSKNDHYGIKFEQTRLPLNNLPGMDDGVAASPSPSPSGVEAPIGSIVKDIFPNHETAFKAYVETLQAAASETGARRLIVFRHPLELLKIRSFDWNNLYGQDLNDNFVLDPWEAGLNRRSPFPVVDGDRGFSVDRGLIDHVTTFTDGRFSPYDAHKVLRDLVVGAFSEDAIDKFDAQTMRERQPLGALLANSSPWQAFVSRYLTDTCTFFRITCHGTHLGQPLARVRLVTEFMVEDNDERWFRVVDWRQD